MCCIICVRYKENLLKITIFKKKYFKTVINLIKSKPVGRLLEGCWKAVGRVPLQDSPGHRQLLSDTPP